MPRPPRPSSRPKPRPAANDRARPRGPRAPETIPEVAPGTASAKPAETDPIPDHIRRMLEAAYT